MEQNDERIDSASRFIKAPAHRIYLAFLDPKAVSKWRPPSGMGCEVYEFDPRRGGKYKMTFKYINPEHNVAGKRLLIQMFFRECLLNLLQTEKIVGQIKLESDDPAFTREMKITTKLTPVKDGTKVAFMAENIPQGIKKKDHDKGMQSTLENLAKFTE